LPVELRERRDEIARRHEWLDAGAQVEAAHEEVGGREEGRDDLLRFRVRLVDVVFRGDLVAQEGHALVARAALHRQAAGQEIDVRIEHRALGRIEAIRAAEGVAHAHLLHHVLVLVARADEGRCR
jgi:hypothetical protein